MGGVAFYIEVCQYLDTLGLADPMAAGLGLDVVLNTDKSKKKCVRGGHRRKGYDVHKYR